MDGQQRSTFFLVKHLAALAVISSLAACGGGGASSTSATSSNDSGGSAPPLQSSPPATSSYLVSWDAVPDPLVTGYKLYYSTSPFSSGGTVQTITVGTLTSYSFAPGSAGVPSGTTVYLAVAATGNGMESPLSDQVSVVVQ